MNADDEVIFLTFDAMNPEIISSVQRWVALDNKVEVKKAKLKEYTDERKELEESIIRYIEENGKTNIQINTSDGFIDFHESKTQQSMTIKYIKETLTEFFSNLSTRDRASMNADTIMEFMLEHRETKTKMTMRRHIKRAASD